MIIEHKNDLWSVLKAQHVKPGKGGAFNQVELKSIKRGTKLNERFRSSDTVFRAILDDKKFSFLYEDENNCHFMDKNNFDSINRVNQVLVFRNVPVNQSVSTLAH
jgi:elongation factor P